MTNFLQFKNFLVLIAIIFLSGCACTQSINKCSTINTIKQLRPQYVAVKNGQLEYYRLGHGTPIILITGYTGDISNWNKQLLVELAQQHELIIFNNRNVGGSKIFSANYNTQVLADDTAQLIQNLAIKKPAVMGMSMGGMIAQQVAVRHPEQISSLILINTAISGDQFVYPDAEIANAVLYMPKNKIGRYFSSLNLFFPPEWRSRMSIKLINERFQPQVYDEFDLYDQTLMSRQQRLLLEWSKDNHTAQAMSKIKVPVLILNGAADVVIPPTNSDILTHHIPKAKLVRWHDGGHAIIFQYPQEMTDEINAFIKEVS